MENINVKMELATGVENLEECIRHLRCEEKPSEFISLFERAKDIVSVVVLNFKDATEEDIKRVSTVLKLCHNTLSPEHTESLSINTENLYTLVESLEEVFRDRRFLLSNTVESVQVSY